MAKVGQISIARPGFPLQLKFDESEVKSVLEFEAQPGDHVTLYPGDYTTWYEGTEATEDTPIEIREGVSVTILPGARVSYTNQFRTRNFAHDGETFDSFNDEGDPSHPLNDRSDSFGAASDEDLSSKRYDTPNFTGHVENIVDMNFGSEWAFESDLKSLQERFDRALGEGRASIAVTTDTQTEAPPLRLGDELQFIEGSSVNISTEAITDVGVEVEIEFDKNFISSLDAGRNLEATRSTGDITINHSLIENIPNEPEVTEDSDEEKASGATVLQNLFYKNGHISDYELKEYATIEPREPNVTDGEQGDIWFVKDRDFLLNLYFSSSTPTQLDGKQGDVWVVGDVRTEFIKASKFFISQNDAPDNGDYGENGSVWLNVPLESDSFDPDPFDIGSVDKIIYQSFTPTENDGGDKDIRATSTRIVTSE